MTMMATTKREMKMSLNTRDSMGGESHQCSPKNTGKAVELGKAEGRGKKCGTGFQTRASTQNRKRWDRCISERPLRASAQPTLRPSRTAAAQTGQCGIPQNHDHLQGNRIHLLRGHQHGARAKILRGRARAETLADVFRRLRRV